MWKERDPPRTGPFVWRLDRPNTASGANRHLYSKRATWRRDGHSSSLSVAAVAVAVAGVVAGEVTVEVTVGTVATDNRAMEA